jgi:DNA-binding CsgD family transcriptional regulator
VKPPRVDQNGYGIRVPGLVISPYARRGFIDHRTLSFDAYTKFIEDDFLGGQRLDPSTDGRPDPRPDVRETLPQLGDLTADFDFSQTPLAPVILPIKPTTDLIAPPSASVQGVPVPGAGVLPAYLIRAAARSLGLTPQELRRELAAGLTLRQIAAQQGVSYNRVTRAIRRRLQARARRGLR